MNKGCATAKGTEHSQSCQCDGKSFDNVIVRTRGSRCIVSLAAAPFSTISWPDISKVVLELGLKPSVGEALAEPANQQLLLSALADKLEGGESFKPRKIGFERQASEIEACHALRARTCDVTFVGNCSSQVVLGALKLLTARLTGKNRSIRVQFKQWDPLTDWPNSQERLRGILAFFGKEISASLMLFSSIQQVPDDFWDFIYNNPSVRLGWIASDLAQCGDLAQFERLRCENMALKNLEALSNRGIWPHIVLPVTLTNTPQLPELVSAMAELTRGGTIELAPSSETQGGGLLPKADDYVAALLKIYKDSTLPLRMVEPQSWVAERIDAQTPVPGSTDSAGASAVVLETGDIYAGRAGAGQQDWHLGKVLQDGALRWDILNAMPETFSAPSKPEQCKACDWRHRCGGIDAPIMQSRKQLPEAQWRALCDFYCAPRRVLFEEQLWDSVTEVAERSSPTPNELIRFHKDGISFEEAPVATDPAKSHCGCV